MTRGIQEANVTCEGMLVKKFVPNGVTIVVFLAEPHVSIHTYPEYQSLFIDAFTCGLLCNPNKIVDTFINELNPTKKVIKYVHRGQHAI